MTIGVLRAPRAVLSLSGGVITPMEVEVEMTTYRKADTFTAKVSLDSTPGMDEFFWSALTDSSVTILATNDANFGGLAPLFTGNVDVVDIDFVARTAHISGRDFGAKLLETKTNETFLNQNTQQIVQTICSRVGLTANVQLPDSGKVGLIYKTDNARTTDQDSLFNLLTRLAQRAGCIFYVTGTTLNFLPADSVTGAPFVVTYIPPTPLTIAQGSFVALRARRNYVLGRKISVRTRSWQLKQKQAVDSEFDSNGSLNGAVQYEFRAPNMTKDQADAHSKGRLNDIVSQEKTLEIDVPGDTSVTPERPIVLVGTGTAFDQTYILSRVRHTFSQGGGYRMQLSTRNKDKGRSISQQATASKPASY